LSPLAVAQPGETSEPIVTTEYGKVRGTAHENATVFQGIPYAAAPTGDRRWRKPAEPQPWDGVRDATKPAPPCAQVPGELPEGSTSEDCLYLNVTAPKKDSGKPRPVVVWMHGGGFYMGTGSSYEDRKMATRGEIGRASWWGGANGA